MNQDFENGLREGLTLALMDARGVIKVAELAEADLNIVEELVKQASEYAEEDKPKTNPFEKGFGEGAGRGLAMAGLSAAALGAYAGAKAINRSMQHSKFLSAVKQAIASSEVLAHEPPSKVLSYGETIFKFAPTVASDVHLLTTMLEAAVRSGGLDYSLIKTITEIEGRHGQNIQIPKII